MCLRERLHSSHKAIPIAALGLDDLLRLPTVAHVRAHGSNTALQAGIGDCQTLPDIVTQLLLGDDSLALRDEVAEYLKHLGRQDGGLPRSAECMELCIEDTVCEAV
jgi:hypothetical protein